MACNAVNASKCPVNQFVVYAAMKPLDCVRVVVIIGLVELI